MIKKSILLLLISALSLSHLFADEGMWIPLLLKKYNIEEMQKLGFKLTAEDIYSVNQACLKDAVVIFGRGCTGEVISDKGLLITNHHCGYGAIQSHSSLEHDYLTDGFWAMDQSEELVNKNLTVTFLKRMEDVTSAVLDGITDEMSPDSANKIIESHIEKLKKEATKETHYEAVVKPFFHGNQYFLFVNEIFKDVRLVAAPPSAIGKFGGDTDNWMWPRHTGDFSMFRIYADKNNEPAEYSKDNVPYKPLKHFNISTKGVKEGDFTMVFGYPGSTEEYAPSFYLQMITEKINPQLIDLRSSKLSIINKYKEQDPAVRIQYAAKYASISNSWKRWIGEIKGLDKLNAVEKKQEEEGEFQSWANSQTTDEYRNILNDYEKDYKEFTPYKLAYNFIVETIFRNGAEIIHSSSYLNKLIKEYEKDSINKNYISSLKNKAKQNYDDLFKDLYIPLDKDMTEMLLTKYKEKIPATFLPDIYPEIDKKHKGNIHSFVDHLYKKTMFTNKDEIYNFIDNFSAKSINKLKKDPAYIVYKSFYDAFYNDVYPEYHDLNDQISALNKIYMKGLMTFDKDKVFYPDANFTLRVGYGQVKAYEPRDAVQYKYYTTLDGIMEKDNPDIYDYRVPEKLKEIYRKKDFGKYTVDGTVPVCFIATNHTTGGNSGSPVLNANGDLIGINFDRAWEGVMSDMMFNPDQCRNISLDIRYVLFLLDKYAGASYLIDEMTLVN